MGGGLILTVTLVFVTYSLLAIADSLRLSLSFFLKTDCPLLPQLWGYKRQPLILLYNSKIPTAEVTRDTYNVLKTLLLASNIIKIKKIPSTTVLDLAHDISSLPELKRLIDHIL